MDDLELAYLRSSFLEPKEWGFGEPSYMMARPLQEPSDRLYKSWEELQGLAGQLLVLGERATTVCDRQRPLRRWTQENYECRRSIVDLQSQARRLQRWASMDEIGVDIDSRPILAQHRAAVYALLNTTALSVATSATFAVASIFELCRSLAKRLEILRWHLTYFLLQLVLQDAKIHYHEYCCSSGEVLAYVAGSLQRNATLVEVGVETGSTSAELFELLPTSMRLVGVDPFVYDVPEDDLSTWEKDQRKMLSMRYDADWLEGIAKAAEAIYANANAADRAGAASMPRGQLWKVTSLEAAKSFSNSDLPADLVFIDADHSEAAVSKDIAAWLRVLSRGRGRRILSGHDFTLMFPGVLTTVLRLSADLRTASVPGLRGTGKLHVAANAVWWFELETDH